MKASQEYIDLFRDVAFADACMSGPINVNQTVRSKCCVVVTSADVNVAYVALRTHCTGS